MEGIQDSKKDIRLMKKVLALAKKGQGMTSPNPLVGAIVEKNNIICGQGYHKKAGTPHAEIIALHRAGSRAKGSTLYVNLEPCCHFGKTPPCTEAIIKSKVSRVVVGMKDPNPLVSGKGLQRLIDAVISVSTGILQTKAKKVNEVFCKYITSGLPFVTVKAAATLDGKIATYNGNSRWVTGEASRHFVQHLRFYHDAIMVGIGTILTDDPSLTCRLPDKKKFRFSRVIIDSRGRIPLNAKVFTEECNHRTIVVVTEEVVNKKRIAIEKRGAEVIVTKTKDRKVHIPHLFQLLGEKGISSVLLEGGGTLNSSIIEHRMADKLILFLAPKIIGGKNAPTFVEGKGKALMNEAVPLSFSQQKWFDDDVMLEYYFNFG